jgi:hypothetical protein
METFFMFVHYVCVNVTNLIIRKRGSENGPQVEDGLGRPRIDEAEKHLAGGRRAISAGLPDFLLVQHTKTGKNIPNDHKMFQMASKYTIWL